MVADISVAIDDAVVPAAADAAVPVFVVSPVMAVVDDAGLALAFHGIMANAAAC